MAQPGSSSIAAQKPAVVHMNAFHATPTSGRYFIQNVVVLVNGPTASVCYAEQWVVACDGSGILRITSGLKFTRNTKGDGSMWMHVKKPGINHDSTQKVWSPAEI